MNEFLIYLQLGYKHITDFNGYDHILFVVALCAIYRITDWQKIWSPNYNQYALFTLRSVLTSIEWGVWRSMHPSWVFLIWAAILNFWWLRFFGWKVWKQCEWKHTSPHTHLTTTGTRGHETDNRVETHHKNTDTWTRNRQQSSGQ